MSDNLYLLMEIMETLPFNKDSLSDISQRIEQLFLSKKQPIIVAIAGGSCSGKSTQVAASLKNIFQDRSGVIHQDHFQLDRIVLERLNPRYGGDDPVNFGIQSSMMMLNRLRNGQSVDIPVYHFRQRKRVGYQTIIPRPIMIFEGLYSLLEPLNALIDFGIYVEMPLVHRLIRRIIRNTKERYFNKEEGKIVKYYLAYAVPAHQAYNVQQKQFANVLLLNRYCFLDSIRKFQLRALEDIQIVHVLDIFRVDKESEIILHRNSLDHFFFSLFNNRILFLHFEIEASVAFDLIKKLKEDF